jgi:hypothetical protein
MAKSSDESTKKSVDVQKLTQVEKEFNTEGNGKAQRRRRRQTEGNWDQKANKDI